VVAPRLAFTILKIEQQWLEYNKQLARDAQLLRHGTTRLKIQHQGLVQRKGLLEAEVSRIAGDIAVQRPVMDASTTQLSNLKELVDTIRAAAGDGARATVP
jgi:hypothetical protein